LNVSEITMLEFRRGAGRLFKRLARGEHFVLTHRGKPVARLEPPDVSALPARSKDRVFRIEDYVVDGSETPFDHRDIDLIVYGRPAKGLP
jgi:antitoxin (DNA-binding transcriptional repressor) of toxin-antitoxin stability system